MEHENKWENKEYRNNYYRNYYLQKTSVKNICACGGVYTLNQKARHIHTKKHTKYTDFNGLTKDELINLLNKKGLI